MSDIQIWYIGNNDMMIQLSGLKNAADDSFINDATVQAHLLDDQGADVSGVSWPVTVPFTGTDGLYRVTVDKAAAVIDDAAYTLTVTATSPGGLDGEWVIPVGGETRR